MRNSLAGISANGVTEVRLAKSESKIDLNYYMNHILKPFITKEISKLSVP